VEELFKAKNDFVATVSHEIRTPLNGIVATAELLSETPLNAEQRELVETIEGCGNHLVTVLNDVLDFSKLESNKFTFQLKPFKLPKCVDSIVDIFKETQKEVTVTSIIDPAAPKYIHGDITRVRQVLINLVSNAVKFTAKGGSTQVSVSVVTKDDPLWRKNSSTSIKHKGSNELSVTVTELLRMSIEELALNHFGEECLLLFSVKDTGIGIAKENWPKIFGAFSQVDSSPTRKYGGTGLGLAISKKLVEAMGGTIWFESEPGKGSTFYFTLKAKGCNDYTPINSSQEERVNEMRISDNVQGILKVLVAEDNSVNQKVITKIITKLGHKHIAVSNGREALKEIEMNDYDVVLMDLQMPVMGGIEAAKEMEKMDWNHGRRPPRIVAVTAAASQGDKLACLQAGIQHFISKPLHVEDIKLILERILKEKSFARKNNL